MLFGYTSNGRVVRLALVGADCLQVCMADVMDTYVIYNQRLMEVSCTYYEATVIS